MLLQEMVVDLDVLVSQAKSRSDVEVITKLQQFLQIHSFHLESDIFIKFQIDFSIDIEEHSQ